MNQERHEDEKHPRIDLNNLDKGLVRFCLEYGKLDPSVKSTLPKRDPADYKWLRMVYDSIEDDGKHMARLLTDIAGYIARADAEKDAAAQDAAVAALEELTDLVENVENANDLVSLGGVPALLDVLRDCTRPRVWAAACAVVAALVANNPRGQQALLAAGALAFLLSGVATFQRSALASSSSEASDSAAEASSEASQHEDVVNAEARALGALAALVREEPAAQQAFVAQGGLAFVRAALAQPEPVLPVRAVMVLWRFATSADGVAALAENGFVAALLALVLPAPDAPAVAPALRERAADVLCHACAVPSARAVLAPHKADFVRAAVAAQKQDPGCALAEYLHGIVEKI